MPIPEGDPPPAPRGSRLSLLGRGQDHLREVGQGRPPDRHRRQRVLDYRLAYGPSSSATPTPGWTPPRVPASMSAAYSPSPPSVNSWSPNALRAWSLRQSSCAFRLRHGGRMAAPRVARGYTGKDSYVVVEGGYHGDSTRRSGRLDRGMASGPRRPQLPPTAPAFRTSCAP